LVIIGFILRFPKFTSSIGTLPEASISLGREVNTGRTCFLTFFERLALKR